MKATFADTMEIDIGNEATRRFFASLSIFMVKVLLRWIDASDQPHLKHLIVKGNYNLMPNDPSFGLSNENYWLVATIFFQAVKCLGLQQRSPVITLKITNPAQFIQKG